MSTREALLKEIEDFLAQHDMTPSAFGLAAINDAKLVGNLRAKKDLRTGTADRIRQFMREYRPPHPKRAARAASSNTSEAAA